MVHVEIVENDVAKMGAVPAPDQLGLHSQADIEARWILDQACNSGFNTVARGQQRHRPSNGVVAGELLDDWLRCRKIVNGPVSAVSPAGHVNGLFEPSLAAPSPCATDRPPCNANRGSSSPARSFPESDSGTRLVGHRVVLRESVHTDESAVHAFASDPVVTQLLTWGAPRRRLGPLQPAPAHLAASAFCKV
jgi:hypothetical protein